MQRRAEAAEALLINKAPPPGPTPDLTAQGPPGTALTAQAGRWLDWAISDWQEVARCEKLIGTHRGLIGTHRGIYAHALYSAAKLAEDDQECAAPRLPFDLSSCLRPCSLIDLFCVCVCVGVSFERAIMLLSELVMFRPRDPKARAARAKAYNALGRYEDELKDRSLLVDVDNDCKSLYERAKTFRALNQNDLAMADITEAFRRQGKRREEDITDWQPFYHRSLTFASMQQFQNALKGICIHTVICL